MLDNHLKTQLAAYLERVVRPVHLAASLDDSAASRELLELLETVVALSPQLTLGRAADERAPSFALSTPSQPISLRFAGLPLGHEFTSLVLALLQVGGHPPRVDADTLAQIAALPGEYRFETYFSQSCQNCPDVVQALNLMAVVNPRVQHVAIDGANFPDEVERRQVMAVPSVFLNGEPFAQGRMTLEQILEKLDAGRADREAAALADRAPYDVLVVGGGPAGASAAIYAARKGIRTGIVAERFGGQVLDTMSIENFISVPETEGPKMVAALEQHVRAYDVDLVNGQRAVGLDPAGEDGLVGVRLASGATLRGRTVIVSTGARWRQLGVPGEAAYLNKGVAYCPHCDGPLFKGKRVAVVGGGNSGVEAAIDLAGIVRHVTLLEFADALKADEVLQRKLRSLPNVTVRTRARTTEVLGDGQRVTGIRVADRDGGDEAALELEGVFVQIGLVPNTEWLAGTVDRTPWGEIIVDAKGRTNLPGVFAAGDATTVPYKQIVIAMGEGSKAALSAFDHLIRVPVAA